MLKKRRQLFVVRREERVKCPESKVERKDFALSTRDFRPINAQRTTDH